jgi:hypothetical protein
MTIKAAVRSNTGSSSSLALERHPDVGPVTPWGALALSLAGKTEAAGCWAGGFGSRALLGDLLVGTGRHDEAAFARFYQLTSPWISYLLRRWTGSNAQAEDATCLVYTTVWRRAASFGSSDLSALAWVTRIAYEVVGS